MKTTSMSYDPRSPLSERQQAACRCVMHVMAKQSPYCIQHPNDRSAGCYNPYAVCTRSVGVSYPRYQCPTIPSLYASAPPQEQVAWALSRGMSPKVPLSPVIYASPSPKWVHRGAPPRVLARARSFIRQKICKQYPENDICSEEE